MEQRTIIRHLSLLLVLLIAIPGVMLATEDEPGNQPYGSKLRTVKWSPLHMIDFPPAAEFAFEYPIGRSRTLQHEIGFISNTVNPLSGSSSSFESTGVRLKTEIRYYNNQNQGAGDFYLAPELSYTYYTLANEQWFTRFDGAYTQLYNYEGSKHMVGANFKLGSVYYSKNAPMSWDFFFGFGVKYRIIDSNIPEDAFPNGPTGSETIDRWYYPENGSTLRFNIVLGFRVGYIFPEN